MVNEKAVVKANAEILPSIAEAMQLGPILIESGMFPGISSKAQAVAKILAGREVGFGPIYSLQMVDLVKGRLHLRSEAMAALINKSGRYRYAVVELTEGKAVIDFYADGKVVFSSTFTLDDARKADLVKADSGWTKYPRDMLWARAMSFGAKKVCPELLAGFEALEDEGLEIVEGEVAKAGEPPPSAWMRFWGAARARGYITDEAVHKGLAIESLKDWLAQGRTLDEAINALPNLTAERDAKELFSSEAKPIKISVARPVKPEPPTDTIPPEKLAQKVSQPLDAATDTQYQELIRIGKALKYRDEAQIIAVALNRLEKTSWEQCNKTEVALMINDWAIALAQRQKIQSKMKPQEEWENL